MQVVLVMFRGDGERRSFSVVRNMTVIGRREDCDLRIPLGDVSRKHCRLVRTDDGIRLEDLGSTHGTLVNGQRVREVELNAGDTIGVGPVMFVVQIDGVPAESDLASPQRAASEAAVDADDSSAGVVHHAPVGHEAELAPGEEFPLEELAPDELVTDETPAHAEAEHPAVSEEAEEMMLEEVPLEEVPLEADRGGDDRTVDHTAAEAGLEEPVIAAEDMTLEGAPATTPAGDEVEELDWLDDEPAAPATHAAAPPPLPPGLSTGRPSVPPPLATPPAAEPGFELDESVEETAEEPAHAAPAEPAPAAEGDWDFVVEETEGDHAHSDFHINLESHHDQPHG
jgi:pSer/pThr/pTyr-binding forkhead associated (FHA) protein